MKLLNRQVMKLKSILNINLKEKEKEIEAATKKPPDGLSKEERRAFRKEERERVIKMLEHAPTT